jgi:hypothetical protein
MGWLWEGSSLLQACMGEGRLHLGRALAGREGSVCNSGGRQWGRSSLLKIQGAMEQEAEDAATKGREGGDVHRE